MTQSNQVADDRADGRASPSARRQSGAAPNGANTSDTLCNFCRLLLEVAINEKKASQAVFRHQVELIFELMARLLAQLGVRTRGWIALVEFVRAKSGEHVVSGRQ